MFTIRKATTEDIPLIHKMAQEVFPATYADILSPDQLDYMMEWMYSITKLRQKSGIRKNEVIELIYRGFI